MRNFKNQLGVWVVVFVMLFPAAVAAWPAAQSNLLNNGNMEGGFNGGVPNGWDLWYVNNPHDECYDFQPTYSSGHEAHEGSNAAMYFLNYHTYTAGIRQTVNVGAGNTVLFTAYGRIISADTIGASSSAANAAVEMKIGIDPTGGTSHASGSIVWSPAINASGGYQKFEVSATATGSSVTVFLYSRPYWCNAENMTFFDSASLVVTGQGSTTTTTTNGGGGAAAPVVQPSIEKAPPRADGSVVHVVQSNQYLNLIAGTYGVSIQQIKDLNDLTNDVIHTGQELLIEAAEGAEAASDSDGESSSDEDAEAEESESSANTPIPPLPTTPPQEIAAAQATDNTVGNLCVLVFDDGNRNGVRDPGEGLLGGVGVTLDDGQQQTSYTTTGVSPNEPYCFMGLKAGNYNLMFSGADFASTAPSPNVSLAVPGGQTVQVEHGAVSLSAGTGETLDADRSESGLSADTAKRLAVALFGAAGVVVLMALAGGFIFLVFLR